MDYRVGFMKEEAVVFGATSSLVGVVTDPVVGARDKEDLPAIILLNAGIAHRVAPHRLYVNMARRFADMGFTVLRFDFSGVGDSPLRQDNLPRARSSIK